MNISLLLTALAEALLHFLWQGTALGILIAVSLRGVRRSETRYALLVGGLLACSFCVPVTTGWLLWQALNEASASAVNPVVLSAELVAVLSLAPLEPVAWNWQHWLLLTWSVGAALCSLRLALGGWGVVRLHHTLQAAPAEWDASIKKISGLFGWSQAPRVTLSERVGEPLALLWWRPVVVLPAAWVLSVPPAVLESVLAHEFAHLQRWDLWVNAWQRLVEAWLFYHPAVWWLSSRIRCERELICDELAVRRLGQPLQYAQALEYVARSRMSRAGLMFAASLGDSRMDLLQRVKRVLGVPTSASSGRWWPAGLAALMIPAGVWLASSGWTPLAVGDDDREAHRERDDDDEHQAIRELRRELERARERIRQQDRELRELRDGQARGGRPERGPVYVPSASNDDFVPRNGRPVEPPRPQPRRGHEAGEENHGEGHGREHRHPDRPYPLADVREHRPDQPRDRQPGPPPPPPPPRREGAVAPRAQFREHRVEVEAPEHRGPEAHGHDVRLDRSVPREALADVMSVVHELRREVSELRHELHQLREQPRPAAVRPKSSVPAYRPDEGHGSGRPAGVERWGARVEPTPYPPQDHPERPQAMSEDVTEPPVRATIDVGDQREILIEATQPATIAVEPVLPKVEEPASAIPEEAGPQG